MLNIIIRIAATFAAFCAIQYIVPYYFLAFAGVIGGFFLLKTSDDRPLALGVLIGSILFAIFAFAMSQIYPVGG